MSDSRRKFERIRQVIETPSPEILRALGDQDHRLDSHTQRLSGEITEMHADAQARWRQEDELLQFLVRRERAALEAQRIERDNTSAAVAELERFRADTSYDTAWQQADPLVSVRIASYLNTEALLNRAIPSVLAQTHQNIELIIVNDGPNAETRAGIERLHDPRIRYVEFPTRSHYPEDRHLRWMVAGSPGMNHGASLARGQWIAPLDDDDAFTPDHIEQLLTHARRTRAEFVYGAIDQIHLRTGEHHRIYSDPPAAGQISMQAALYHAGLRMFEYDTESWRVDEPGDWNLIRRMMRAGVRMAGLDQYVTEVHMVLHQDKTYL